MSYARKRLIAEYQVPGQYMVSWYIDSHEEHVVLYGSQMQVFSADDSITAAGAFGRAVWYAADRASLFADL